MVRTLPAFLSFAVASVLVAQNPPVPTLTMLADLNHTSAGTGSSPLAQAADLHTGTGDRHQFVRFGALVVFAAEHEDHGQEPWVTDGAPNSWPNGKLLVRLGIAPVGPLAAAFGAQYPSEPAVSGLGPTRQRGGASAPPGGRTAAQPRLS